MARPSGTQIGEGKEVKAAPINADFDNHETRLQAIEALLQDNKVRLSAVYADIDMPSSWLPPRIQTPEIKSAMHSMALYNQALRLPFRRGSRTSSIAADNPGWGAPGFGGFVVCDQDNDEVHVFTQKTSTGGWGKQTYQMAAGDAPIHAAVSASGQVFVSCPGTSKVRRINTLAGDGAVSDFYDLTAIHQDYGAAGSCEKLVLNRLGTYLYLIAKRTTGTADNNFRRVIQIAVDTQAGVEQSIAETVAGQDIVDLVPLYPGATSSDTAMVCVAIKTKGSSTGEIRRKSESSWGTGTITDVFATMTAGDILASISAYGSGLAAVGHYGAVTGSWSRIYVWDDVTGSAGNFVPVQRDTGNTFTSDDGSLASDGERLWWTGSGRLLTSHPNVEAAHAVLEPQAGWQASGTFQTGSGCVYTGHELVLIGNIGAVAGEFAVVTV